MKLNWFLLLALLAFIFRLWLTPTIYHVDLLSQASWGDYVANKGPLNLYSYNIWTFSWPNHPPLTSLYYGFCFEIFKQLSLRLNQSLLLLGKLGQHNNSYTNFVRSFDNLVSPGVPYPLGFMISLKLVPILSDIIIASCIYFIAFRKTKRPYLYFVSFLFLPFSWYISALWGQTDQMAFLFILISIITLFKVPFISIVLFFIGLSLKPTSLFLVPIYLFYIYKSRPNWMFVILSIILCCFINYLIFVSFSNESINIFTFQRLLPRLLDRPPRLTTNSYNFWHIFVLNQNTSDSVMFLLLPAKIWGFLMTLIVNLGGIIIFRKFNLKYAMSSMFIVSFGSWLFLPDMLERYVFAGIVFGLISSIFYPKLYKYWLILSFIFWLNLFRGWWFPTQLFWLRDILEANNYLAGLFLSLINVVAYLIMVGIILKAKTEKLNHDN